MRFCNFKTSFQNLVKGGGCLRPLPPSPEGGRGKSDRPLGNKPSTKCPKIAFLGFFLKKTLQKFLNKVFKNCIKFLTSWSWSSAVFPTVTNQWSKCIEGHNAKWDSIAGMGFHSTQNPHLCLFEALFWIVLSFAFPNPNPYCTSPLKASSTFFYISWHMGEK